MPARRIVPDLAAESAAIAEARARARDAIRRRLRADEQLIAGVPQRIRDTVRRRIESDRATSADSRDRLRAQFGRLLVTASADLGHVRARVVSLSPQATLDRGYAVVTRVDDGGVVRTDADADRRLRVRVAHGDFEVQPVGSAAS